jgi:hypothetical protein
MFMLLAENASRRSGIECHANPAGIRDVLINVNFRNELFLAQFALTDDEL